MVGKLFLLLIGPDWSTTFLSFYPFLFAGFKDPLGQCLGQDGNFSRACENPLEYINWDGIHYTEAANKWIANRLQDGSFSAPNLPLKKSCQAILGSQYFL